MIEGLEAALERWAADGAAPLCDAIERLFGDDAIRGRLVAAGRVRRERVMRLVVEVDGRLRSLIVKRFPPDRARRERDAIERWLPRVGLEAHGPPLLTTAGDCAGRFAWFAYEDLGDCTLAGCATDARATQAAIDLVAELHARCAEQPFLAEARSLGGDLGIPFYSTSVRDASRALRALEGASALDAEQRSLCARLRSRIDTLRDEEADRADLLAECGGPETLLHGDLWTINVLVRSAGRTLDARLIDWDHAGVGPVSYDLSALLAGFPPAARGAIVAHYQARYDDGSAVPARWPSRAGWNALFDTAERARLANAIVWRALSALDGHVEWAFSELSWYDAAFDALGPLLPEAAQSFADDAGADAEFAAPEPR